MTKKYSVLVVDDQENWRDLLVELLEDDFGVVSAESYETALHKVQERSEPFHVIVTDMRLVDEEKDNEDGLRLVEAINQRGSATKAIVVTGYPTLHTAKRALGTLDVFDYLEKYPSDGSSFKAAEFLRLVRDAAEAAERERPQGLTLHDNRLLLLVSDASLRESVEKILRKNYGVTVVDDFVNLTQALENLDQSFPITLISEDLADNEAMLDALQETQPNTKIILLTEQPNKVLELLHRTSIANAIPISRGKPDRLQILDGIQQVFASTSTKYAVLEIRQPGGEPVVLTEKSSLEMGTPYTVLVQAQDTSTPDSFPIILSSTKGKKKDVVLDVFIITTHIKIAPAGNLEWRLPAPLEFQITGIEPGEKKLSLEVRQGYRLAGKKEVRFAVS